MTRPRLLIDTVPLSRLLEGDPFHLWLVGGLRACGYRVGSTEAVLVETLYFAEKSRADLADAATGILAILEYVEALREEPLRSPLLSRLGYADTELVMAATAGNALLLTGDERLALEAQARGVNAYVADWLLSLEPDESMRLLCPLRAS